MGNTVHITFLNGKRLIPIGVYSSREAAQKAIMKKDGYANYIKEFEIEGTKQLDYPHRRLDDYCKYFSEHMATLRILISALYDIEGCNCGGLAHIVTDDNNFKDEHLDCVLKLCDEEENKDREERGLVKLIMEELKKLSIQERAFLFSSYFTIGCDQDCEKCNVSKGIMLDY